MNEPKPYVPGTVPGMVRALSRLAWPTMLSRSGILIMAFVDIVMVGRYATEELAYAALGFSLFIPALVTTIGLQFGVVPEIARNFGAGNLRNCGAALRRGLPWALVTGIVAGVFVAFSGFWLTLMGHEPNLARESGKVAVAISVGLPLQILYAVCSFYLEATRRPLPGLIFMLGANFVNIGLNWVLIYGNLGFPALGAVGSGISTSGVRVFLCLVMFTYILTRPDARAYGIYDRTGSFWGKGGWAGGRSMRRIGFATCVSFFAETGAYAAVTQFAGFMGTAAVAAYSIAHNLLALLFMLSLGVASATAVMVGNADGQDNRRGVLLAGWTGTGGCVVLMVVCGVLILLLDDPITALYTTDSELIIRTVPLLAIVAAVAWLDGSQVVAAQAVRGLGDSWPATRLLTIAWLGVFVPSAWVLGFWAGLEESGLIWASGVGSVVALGMMIRRFAQLAQRVADLSTARPYHARS